MFDKPCGHLINSRISRQNLMNDIENNTKTFVAIPPENGIGQRIKDLRKKYELTVEQLSALTASYDYGNDDENTKGIAVSTLYLYEKGSRSPRAKELRLLCDSLNVTPTYMVMGQDWGMSPVLRAELNSIVDKLSNLLEGEQIYSDEQFRELEHMAKLLEVKNDNAK